MGKITKVVSAVMDYGIDEFLEDYWYQNISNIDMKEYESFKTHQRKSQNSILGKLQKATWLVLDVDSSLMYIDKTNKVRLIAELV